MTVASEAAAIGVLRGLLENNTPAAVTALRWQNEDKDSNGQADLPATPATFVLTLVNLERSGVIEIGAGRGGNRHRCSGELEILVFVPRGKGIVNGDGSGCLEIAGAIAATFRSFNQDGVTVESATAAPGGAGAALKPPGVASDVSRYFWALVSVEFYFDLIG